MRNNSNDDQNGLDLYEERLKTLENALGPAEDTVLHAVVPFQFGFDLGGRADVYIFKRHLEGVVYVTAELLGSDQMPNQTGSYELMICHREESDWGPRVISSLAYYTLESVLNPGETMDLGLTAGEGSEIKHFVFDRYRELEFLGEEASIMVCLGITQAELDYKSDHGGFGLLALLKEHGVYPFTDLGRKSVPLP